MAAEGNFAAGMKKKNVCFRQKREKDREEILVEYVRYIALQFLRFI